MIGSSAARIKKRLTDGDVIVVEVFKEPLLGQGLLGVLDISLRDEVVVGLITCGGVAWPRCSSSAAKKQEEQEDKRDEEIRDEVNGEVEEVTHRAHETCG